MRYWLFFIFILLFHNAHAQQDMDLHLSETFLSGKNIIKIKRDFNDPYLWVLAQNNQVFRINSITKIVDDFSARFSAYGNYKFIDIAGDDKDAVFIATDLSTIIKYKNGTINLIGSADGLMGSINSIGFDYIQTGIYYGNGGNITKDQLLIATTEGIFRYYVKNSKIASAYVHSGNSQIFESTFRTEMTNNLPLGQTWPDEFTYYPTGLQTPQVLYLGYIFLGGGVFGNTIKTAFYINGEYYQQTGFSIYGDQFWATENGLFRNRWNQSGHVALYYQQYLNGIDITKITSIYGLNDFLPFTRENLLIGSKTGLYFSTSVFAFHQPETKFTHFDGLGDKTINDICVNATSYTIPACENGVWVAAVDGLYLLKPDYGAYVNGSQQLQTAQFEGQDNNVASTELCANTTVNALLNNYMNSALQWYKNGQEIPNESNNKLKIKEAGDYYAVLYDPCSGLHFESNHLKVTQIADPVFSFNYPDVLNYCEGSDAILKTDNKPQYNYRWYKNNVLTGNITPILDINQSGEYRVEVSACQGNWVSSKKVKLNFISIPKPTIAKDKNAYCNGDQATLSATVPIDGSQIINWAPYQYKWYKNGALIDGTNATIKVNQTGQYHVEVTGCSGTISSDEMQVVFGNINQPAIIADKQAYCIGDNAKLTVDFSSIGTFSVNWFRNGDLLNDEQGKTFITTNKPGNYTVIIKDNATTCQVLSTAYVLSFSPPPTISVQQIVNTTLCDGEMVNLKASYSGGTISWTTGATSDQITVQHSGTYTATVTTTAGCISDEPITVQFLPNPILSIPAATICQYTNESITLTAPDGFVKYEWNGQAGGAAYSTNKLGSVNLTVTDHNGCKASQTIVVSSHCADIHVPNTFTPNGDGHNDTWLISGLEGDLLSTVRVYNRSGSLLFQSKGYAIPWDGTYNDKKLPAGVYFYVISTQGNKQVLSGSVTILY